MNVLSPTIPTEQVETIVNPSALAHNAKRLDAQIGEYKLAKKKKQHELEMILVENTEYNALDVDIENFRQRKADLRKKLIAQNHRAKEIVDEMKELGKDIKATQLSLSETLFGYCTNTKQNKIEGRSIIKSLRFANSKK